MSEVEFPEIDNFLRKLKKLDGQIVGEIMMSSEQTLFTDDRSAVIDAAAMNIEQKKESSDDLKKLLNELSVTDEEIIQRMVIRHVNEVLK